MAVIYGPSTSSSGEAVAVAFRGRANTKSFGQPTAGRANTNSSYELPDGSMLFITTAIDVDRNGNEFGEELIPDQLIEPNGTPDKSDVIKVASEWLLGSVNSD